MASSNLNASSGMSDSGSIQNTTFVQADPSNFREVVQRLTGSTQDSSAQKLPVSPHPRLPSGKPVSGEMGPRRSAFKLHERRQTARKLEIKLGNGYAGCSVGSPANNGSSGITSRQMRMNSFSGNGGEMIIASPVSPLEMMAARGSPRTPRSPWEEEERAIAEKGFYFHPSPLSTPRGSEPPELLPLFPLSSHGDD